MSKFTFAHLIGRKAKATEEDDEKARKAEEDERDEEAEGDDPDAEDHDDEKEGRKAKKAKSKKAEDDDEDPDAEDDDEDENVKKGRRAEQKRCAQIFGSKAAAGRPDMAAHLAFNTSLSASEAISTLKTMGSNPEPQSNRRSLDARMREEEQVRLGQDAEVAPKGSAASLVNKMTNLYNSNKGGK